MARTNQRLINYHTSGKTVMPSGSNVEYGEIVVRHNSENPELLIKVGENSFGVFQASGAVQTSIDNAISAAKTLIDGQISSLETSLSGHVADFESFQEEVNKTFATKSELETLESGLTSAYTEAVSTAKAEAISAASAFTMVQLADVEGRLNGSIDGVESNLASLSGQVTNITVNIGDNYVSNDVLSGALETVSSELNQAKADVLSSANTYADSVLTSANTHADSAITAAEGRIQQVTDGLASNINTLSGQVEAISAYTTNTFATKDDVAGDVADLNNNIASAKSEAIATASAYTDAQVAEAKNYADSAVTAAEGRIKQVTDGLASNIETLSGNTSNAIESLESALTETINNKVSVAYRYAGSCAYDALPASGSMIGEVWNVTDEHDNFPAGTNYAWNGSAWDALGGSVDLSPYAKTEEVNATVGSINQAIDAVNSNLGTVSAATNALVGDVKDYADETFATKVELESVESGLTSAYTEAVSTAKAEAISAASAYTDSQVSAAEGRIQQVTDGIASNVDALSAATVTIQGTANSAIQTASADTNSNVSITKEGTALKFDFSELVIDCGDF